MLIKKLTLHGFKSYKEKTIIDFSKMPENQIFLILGKTGSGKSSIFHGIIFALYGTPSDFTYISEFVQNSLKEYFQKNNLKAINELSKKNPICFVGLEFQIDEKNYKVNRSFEIKKKNKMPSKIQDFLELKTTFFENGKEIDPYNLKNILKIQKEQFKQIILLPQNEFDKFLKSDKTEKEEILKTIFNTEKYEEFINFINNKRKSIRGDYDKIFSHIQSKLESNKIPFIEKEKILEEFKKREETLHQSIQEISHKVDMYLKELKKLQENEKEFYEQINLTQKFKNLYEDLQKHIKNKEEIKEKEKRLQKAKSVSDIYQIWKNLEKQKKEEKNISDEVNDIKIRLEFLKNQYHELLNQKEVMKILDDNLKRLNEKKSQIEDLIPKVEKYENLKKPIQEKQKHIAKKQKEKEEIKNKIANIENSILEIYKDIISRSLKENEACPICGSKMHPEPYHTKNKSIHSEKLIDELKNLKKELENTENTINSEEKYLNLLMGQKQELEKDLKRIFFNLEYEKDLLNRGKKKLQEIIQNIQDSEKKIKQYEDEKNKLENHLLKLETSLKEKEMLFHKIQEEIKEVFTTIEQKTKERNISIDEIENHYLDYKEQEKIDKEINNYRNKEIELKSQLNSLEEDLKKKSIDVTNILKEKKLESFISNLQNEKEKISEKIIDINRENNNLQTEKGKYQEQLENIKNIKYEFIEDFSKLEEIEKRLKNYEKLYKILSDENVRNLSFHRFMIQNYFNNVIYFANQRLKEIQPRYKIFISEEKEKARDRKAGLNLKIYDSYIGNFRERISDLSGGETFYVSLCLALGLYDTIHSKISGLQFDLLFIDEGFGSLDIETLEVVLKTLRNLNNLKDKFKQIGIISHVEHMKKEIPYQILVKNYNGESFIDYKL